MVVKAVVTAAAENSVQVREPPRGDLLVLDVRSASKNCALLFAIVVAVPN